MAAKNSTVLLVEDNEDNLLIYSTILRHSGYAVVEARDGQAGIDAAKKEHPGLILMDVSIPVIDGLEATRRLKADAATKDIPIIALTAKAMKGDREKCLQAGASDYVTKPVDLNYLFSVMRVWLAKLGDPAGVLAEENRQGLNAEIAKAKAEADETAAAAMEKANTRITATREA